MTRSLLVTLLLGATACSGATRDEAVPHWTLVEEMRLGGADTGKASFTGILGLAIGEGGSIWLVDHDAPEIRVFDREGRFVRTIGRRGQGPGEMEATNGFALGPNGTVWVPDYRLGRYNLFDTTGRFISMHIDLIRSYGYTWEGGVDSAGRLFDQITVRHDTSFTSAVRRFRDTSLARADTFPVRHCTTAESPIYRLTAKNGFSQMSVPFTAREVTAVGRTGVFWCSPGDASSAVAIGIEGGDPVARIDYARTRLPVPPAARDSAVAAITKMAHEMGADLPNFGQIPEVQQAVTGIRIDDQGRVWLRVPDPDSTRFDLFDGEGRRLAEVTGPKAMLRWGPLAFRGDTLLAVIDDADGVPVVVRFHIAHAPAGR